LCSFVLIATFQEYFRRVIHFRQLDFELAMFQMLYLVISPKTVYRNVKLHKQTKNQWARDDPAFVLFLVALLFVASASYAIAFFSSFLNILWLILWTIFIDFFAWGFLFSTLTWLLCNAFLRVPPSPHLIDQKVEWLYAWDIHCNAFFLTFLTLYFGQFVLLPLLYRDGFLASLFANILYFISAVFYFYISFLGYQALPFLERTERLLIPIVVAFFACLIATFTGINLTVLVMNFYF